MPHRHSVIILILIIVAVFAGVVSGWVWGEAMLAVAWLGDLFLRALTMVVIPLLVAAVISGVTSLGDVRKLGRVGGLTLAYYFVTGGIAVLTGLILVNVIQPGVGVSTAGITEVPQDTLALGEATGFKEIFLSLVAPNLIMAAAETEMLPIIVWSVVFGLALTTLGEVGRPAAKFFESFNQGMMKVVVWIMYFAPIGIFGLVAGMFAKAGGGPAFWAQVQAVGLHVVTVLAGLAVHFTILFIILLLLTGRGLGYLVGMLRAIFTAFATASSSATLPITMECAQEQEVDRRAAQFVMPLGSTVNMDGTALYEAAAAMFIAQAYGVDLGLGQQAIIFITATLAAIGAAGIPQAGLVTMIIVLKAVGLPLEGIGMLLAVDWFLDRFRTATNVWGDAVGAAFIHRVLERSEGQPGPSVLPNPEAAESAHQGP